MIFITDNQQGIPEQVGNHYYFTSIRLLYFCNVKINLNTLKKYGGDRMTSF